MAITVELTKFMTQGLLKGEQIVETMRFVNFAAAIEWATGVNHKDAVPYGVEMIRNLKTNEVETFF